MDIEVENAAKFLCEAVKIMSDPNPHIPYIQRTEAYKSLETFKESSPLCAQVGVLIARNENDPILRHLGIQLIEHVVRVRWPTIDPKEKDFVKENALLLLAQGTRDILIEQRHIKDAVSRLIVEIIKRDWPHNWRGMTSELDVIYKTDVTRCELVLLVFLRLAEDMLTLQTMSGGRRRDVLNALSTIQPELFSCFINSLIDSYQTYFINKSSSDEQMVERGSMALRLTLTILETLIPFLDWVTIGVLMTSDGKLLQLLCVMLCDQELQLNAAECLLVITNRKGREEDRQPLLMLFHEEAMNSMVQSAKTSAGSALENKSSYIFLEKLCKILVALGNQLCHLWTASGSGRRVCRPPTFANFLEAVFAFNQHPSQVLSEITQTLWHTMFKHNLIKEDEMFGKAVPQLINVMALSMAKVGFPSLSNSESCKYSRLVFDCDEEFSSFFFKYRVECGETLRLAALHSPGVAFSFISDRVQNLIQKATNTSDKGDLADDAYITYQPYIDWESTQAMLDYIMSSLFLIRDTPDELIRAQAAPGGMPATENIVNLFSSLLQFETQDGTVTVAQLSMLSSLFPVINNCQNLVPTILNKLFSALVFGAGEQSRTKIKRMVTKHACGVLVKFCKIYPSLLLPVFTELFGHVKQLFTQHSDLYVLQKVALIESLILVSNAYKDFSKQSAVISEILTPTRQFWFSPEFKEAVWNVDGFISFIGLNKSSAEVLSDDRLYQNRHQMHFCSSVLCAVLRRSACPESAEDATSGGFGTGSTDSAGKAIFKNPATRHVLDMLENILALNRTLALLHLPENKAKCHSDFSKIFVMSEADMLLLTGQPVLTNDSTDDETMLGRMRILILNLFENCAGALGLAADGLSHEFYQLPNLVSSLVNTVIALFPCLPDFRLRTILRSFLKSYVTQCPKEYISSAVLPVFSQVTSYMHGHLTEKWNLLEKRYLESCEENNGEPLDDEDNTELQEVIENQEIRVLTMEYIEIIRLAIVDKPDGGQWGSATQEGGGGDDEMQEDMEGCEEGAASAGGGGGGGSQLEPKPFSHLGQILLSDQSIFAFNQQAWPRLLIKCKNALKVNKYKNSQAKSLNVYPVFTNEYTAGVERDCSSLMIVTIFKALTWRDSVILMKCSKLTFPLLQMLVSQGRLLEEDVNEYMICLLVGLQNHGQHEQCKHSLLHAAVRVYCLISPLMPSVRAVLLQIPGCSEEALQKFEKKYIEGSDMTMESGGSEKKRYITMKKRKDAFGDLISSIIGKNISQKYQYEKVNKKDSESGLFKHTSRKQKPPPVLDFESRAIDIGICALFGGES